MQDCNGDIIANPASNTPQSKIAQLTTPGLLAIRVLTRLTALSVYYDNSNKLHLIVSIYKAKYNTKIYTLIMGDVTMQHKLGL